MKKKVLFIDRDGTLVLEPPITEQIDALEQLEFIPKVIRNLYNIRKNLDFVLTMVSNQDGLGTQAFPEKLFYSIQNKILCILKNEGIQFDDIFIDRTFPEDKKPTRKPGIAMLSKYINADYDIENSFVIGDRMTDVMLAKNLKCKAILIGKTDRMKEINDNDLTSSCALITEDWDEIYKFLALPQRTAEVKRKTDETDINISVNLDGFGKTDISTGLNFFDHLLSQIGKHAGIDLKIDVKGDLEVDEHHTIEDTALALGEVLAKSIGNKAGMERYGYMLPMDDCLAQVAIDFGGRSWLVWDVQFKREMVGDVPTEMFMHFFKSFSDAARCNLNIKAEGENEHHKIEAIFKALAKAIKMAIRRDPENRQIPSTKGVI
jgi:imidazoleglycerol-phosphate dehydratase / histidinol-phosphatase